ncbi:hypothetical protein AV530_009366 [Patagioenas fasciata monilis]|uniref:Uncharacterized protein n=1 Tax=Patagioenas fasciata monilis TaxID=372326 RepID=A0A1V4JIR0_PATFA|nr:hypothetical protein AV530_009366 [Patagioenas fasciata monilis]
MSANSMEVLDDAADLPAICFIFLTKGFIKEVPSIAFPVPALNRCHRDSLRENSTLAGYLVSQHLWSSVQALDHSSLD